MSESTKIAWTDASWNPVVGCSRVSEGCRNCYAERFAHRWRNIGGHALGGLTREGGGWNGTVRLNKKALDLPLRWRKPKRIFVNSMSDLFHEGVPDEFIARVWQVMGAAPEHIYQILTKRPERMRSWVGRWYAGEIAEPYEARPVAGYPGYSVTTHGQVLGKRADTSGGLSPDAGEQGHLRVTMHREGSPKSGERELVHRLVLAAFVRPARAGEQACHRNGDPSDNRLSNLYWGSQETNWGDRIRHGRGRSYSKLTEEDIAAIRSRCAAGEAAYRVAKDYPVSDTQIRNVISGRQWTMPPAAQTVRAPARVVLGSVWLGVSCENQATADERIPLLLGTPAAKRFVSYEPALGPVEFAGAAGGNDYLGDHYDRGEDGIDWIIVGGESGPNARPCGVAWIRSVVDQCKAAGVAVFVKQLGARTIIGARDARGFWFSQLDPRDHGYGDDHVLAQFKSRAGSDPSEWPEDLRVQEFAT